MKTKITFIISVVIVLFVHAILLNNYIVKKQTQVIAQKTSTQIISLKKVVIKQKEKKKVKEVVKKQIQKKKKPEQKYKKIVKKAFKKVPKKLVKKEIKKVEKPKEKIVKKEQKLLKHTVTKKVLEKKTTKIVSSTIKERVKNDYLIKLREKIEKYKKYPKRAKRLNQQGQVIVSFKILKNGKIIQNNIVSASKFKYLNLAAIELIDKVASFEPIPKELGKNSWDIEIPINYYIR